MALNLNPALIASAQLYTTPLQRTSLKTCGNAPKEGFAGVQIQINYAAAPGTLVDMASGGSANPPLSQSCGLWIDNSQSSHDINIVVPDSGQVIRVAFGAQKMAPLFTSLAYPKFYVMLDDNGNTNSDDMTSIIVLNQYLPEYSSEDFSNVLAYGYGSYFELVPTFSQSGNFSSTLVNPTINQSYTILNAHEWYITALNLNIQYNNTSGSPIGTSIRLSDGTSGVFYQRENIQNTGQSSGDLINLSGLNYKSSGTGAMTFEIVATNQSPSAIYDINIMGGILTD